MSAIARRSSVLFAPALVVFAVFFLIPVGFFFIVSFWELKFYELVPGFSFDNYVEIYREYLHAGIFTFAVMLPPLVLALALATAFLATGLNLSVFTVIPSHLVFTQPFVILIVYAQMVNFDHAVVESARDLGASRTRAFFTVVLPIIRPTIIGAALIAMAVSLDDFVITFFTIGGGMTLPTLIWEMLRTAIDPSINALGTLIIVATIGSSAIALHLTRYRG